MLSQAARSKLAARLRLADGLLRTVNVDASSSEYEIRNSISRLYYATFHASLAVLLGREIDVEALSRNHGRVHDEIQKEMGKWIGRQVRDLGRIRRMCDYEPDMMAKQYRGDVEQARKELILLVRSARKTFHWMYNEARKKV